MKPSMHQLQDTFERLQLILKQQQGGLIPLKQRRAYLVTLKKLLQENANVLAEAISRDFSYRASYETYLMELFPTINAIKYCLRNMKAWSRDRKREVSWLFKPAKAWITPQPLGLVGIMVPWNYPLLLALEPLAYALAAGNKIMIKMSELTPATGAILAELIHHSLLSDVVTIVNGDIESSKAFASLPFDHLFFTGSTAIGKKILQAAAPNLTPVTLELGGKSPAILSTTACIKHLPRLFMGKFVNAGQTCVAPDYLCIPNGWEELLERALQEFVEKHYANFPNSVDYSSIISEAHFDRLQFLLKDAIEKGARVVRIGGEQTSAMYNTSQMISNNNHRQTWKMPLYLLFNVNHSMCLMQEEIFGPLLPILSYNSFIDVRKIILANPDPLVIYYFGSDAQEKTLLEKSIRSGGLSINDTLTHVAIDDLPFGGIGKSGMGQYHGREGFDRFSALKAVFHQGHFSLARCFYPALAKWVRRLLLYLMGARHDKKFLNENDTQQK